MKALKRIFIFLSILSVLVTGICPDGVRIVQAREL